MGGDVFGMRQCSVLTRPLSYDDVKLRSGWLIREDYRKGKICIETVVFEPAAGSKVISCIWSVDVDALAVVDCP